MESTEVGGHLIVKNKQTIILLRSEIFNGRFATDMLC